MAGGFVGHLETDLDPFSASVGKALDAGREDVTRQASALVIVLGSHGLDETRGRRGVVPEQPMGRPDTTVIQNEQVEVRAVERRLAKAFLNVGARSFDPDSRLGAG